MTLARKPVDIAKHQARLAGRKGATGLAKNLAVATSACAPVSEPGTKLPESCNGIKIAGFLVSVAILAAVVWQMRTLRLAELRVLFPTNFAFWSVFACYYVAGPVADWIIFSRLWSIPISGIVALLRKLISNEILFGYIGEVYFYAWARRNLEIVRAPFGAIKDVSVLSALVGNATTLVMMLAATPLIGKLDFGLSKPMFVASATVLCLPSIGMFVFRKKLFVLSEEDLRFIFTIHLARNLATTLLAALMWHILLPSVPVRLWVVLGTLRLIVSRVPFITNKDLVFAGFAAFVVGKEAGIAPAMALMATMILAAHLCVGALLGVAELTREAHGRWLRFIARGMRRPLGADATPVVCFGCEDR